MSLLDSILRKLLGKNPAVKVIRHTVKKVIK